MTPFVSISPVNILVFPIRIADKDLIGAALKANIVFESYGVFDGAYFEVTDRI